MRIIDGQVRLAASDVANFLACRRLTPWTRCTRLALSRGGRVNVVVLGAYQVDAEGSFANWQTTG